MTSSTIERFGPVRPDRYVRAGVYWSLRHHGPTLTIFATEGTLSALRMNSM